MTNIYHFFFWQEVCAGLAHPVLIFISSSLYFLLLFYRYLFTYLVARTSATRLMKLTLLVSLFLVSSLFCGLLHDVFSLWVLTPSPLKFVMECSATPAFWWHETNFFLCLTTSALIHDLLQFVSFHPHSHSNLLRIAQRASATFERKLTIFVLFVLSLSTSTWPLLVVFSM
jgi:hypothetical protein